MRAVQNRLASIFGHLAALSFRFLVVTIWEWRTMIGLDMLRRIFMLPAFFFAPLCSHKRAHNPFSSSFTLLLQQWPVGKPSCVHSLMMLSHKAHCNLCSNFDSGSWHAVDGLFWLLGSQRFGDLTFVRLFLKDEAKCALLPMLLCHLMRH